MPELADYLSILGLDVSASGEVLKAAYRREMKQWHPDLFQDDPPKQATATEFAKKINLAYEHLSELHQRGFLPFSSARHGGHGTSTPREQRDQPTRGSYT